MNKKLIKQIRNEWTSNAWLFVELLLVSVVMWFIVDYVYVKASIYMQPRGFDISYCYKIEMGELTDTSPHFIPNRTNEEREDDIRQLVERLRLRPEIKAIGLGQSAHPYNKNNSSTSLQIDTLYDESIFLRSITPGFIEVFRYEGANGETSEQLAELLEANTVMASEDVYKYTYDKNLTPYIGKQAIISDDSINTYRLAASLIPIRYDDYVEPYYNLTMLLPLKRYNTYLELCVRLYPQGGCWL